MPHEHSIRETINMLDRISRHLNPIYEPKEPNSEEKAVHLSTSCRSNDHINLKEKRENVH